MWDYLLTSERLGFRNWIDADIAPMAEINADPEVMRYFPATKTVAETADFINRMQKQMADKSYCYFAVDKLDGGAFIGFIGLSDQIFPSSFTPCTDIGWRLRRQAWNEGYATEGAKACLEYAFNQIGLPKVNSMAPKANSRSEQVMKKIGMTYVSDFLHPLLAANEALQECVLYEITSANFSALPLLP